MNNIDNLFRITTNGYRYRVEKFVTRGMWFWKKNVWVPLGSYRNRYFIDEQYKSLAVAKTALRDAIIAEKARVHGWVPIKSSTV